MRPAFSVIVFTTLAGAGQGLFLAIFTAEIASAWVGAAPVSASFLAVGAALAAGLATLGLAASFLHLGHPERAWRAAAMWRTSWLSREVIALPIFIAACAAYAIAHYLGAGVAPWIGAVALVACAGLFLCTAMIYICLRFLQEWASPLTLLNFVLLGAASGSTLAAPLAKVMAPQLLNALCSASVLLTLAAFTSRVASLRRNARLRPKSSLQSAIGVTGARIRQASQGFTGSAFNTREFFHGSTPQKLLAVKWCFLLLVFPVPVVVIVAGALSGSLPLLSLAFPIQYFGLLFERWYFFAQARHPQNIYYQAMA